jgi:hypothetical protein
MAELIKDIKWEDQHCGVHQASGDELFEHMPDLKEMIVNTFPERINNFIWDVKVHMLMPNQYPCIPNWHFDNIPRVNNKQDFGLVRPDLPMYLWISDTPLTEFRDGRVVEPKSWNKFTQEDEHRGTMSGSFCWRGFIRATHKGIMPQVPKNRDNLRRHSQVYLDSSNFSW